MSLEQGPKSERERIAPELKAAWERLFTVFEEGRNIISDHYYFIHSDMVIEYPEGYDSPVELNVLKFAQGRRNPTIMTARIGDWRFKQGQLAMMSAGVRWATLTKPELQWIEHQFLQTHGSNVKLGNEVPIMILNQISDSLGTLPITIPQK